MAYNHFDYVPSTINRKRSVFNFDQPRLSSAYIGYLYPMCKPIRMQPGSTLSLNLAAEIRSGALVSPLADELYCDCFSFFVPNRIVFEHWKQHIGAVDDVLFNSLTTYDVPSFKFGQSHALNSGEETFQWNQLIACHFGLPYPGATKSTLANCPIISALPFRGYNFIWSEFFRPESIVAPVVPNKTDAGWQGINMDNNLSGTVVIGGTTYHLPSIAQISGATQTDPQTGGIVLPTYRAHRSLWTSCLPAPSLKTLNLLSTVSGFPEAGSVDGSAISSSNVGAVELNTGGKFDVSGEGAIGDWNWSDVVLTVNNYRETIMLQNYYDCLNRAGSRYDEILFNIFGSRAGNSVIDIPELITHKRFTIYRNQVVATAEGTNTPIGSQAGYIDTVIKDNFFTRSTTEHGYIHLMYTIRPARIRTNQGVEADWTQLTKFDLYYPQFDGMGDVKRGKAELYWDWTSSNVSNMSGILGYQEYGAEWKYQRPDAVGFLDRNTPNPIVGMSLQEKLSAAPTLNDSFLSCIGEFVAFADCLAISSPALAPQFVCDFRLNGTIAHPMPVYNIPGNGALL